MGSSSEDTTKLGDSTVSRKSVIQKRCQEYADGEFEDGGVVVVKKVSFTLVETTAKYGDLKCSKMLHHHTPEDLLMIAEEDPEEMLDAIREFLSSIGMATVPVAVEKPARSKKKRGKKK